MVLIQTVGPDLGPNCLQRLSTVLTSFFLVLFDELDDDESKKALFYSCIDDFKLWIWKEARLL